MARRPLAPVLRAIASFAMALRYSFGMIELATKLETAISDVLEEGLRTGDIMQDGCRRVGTAEMGDAIIAKLG